MPTRELREHYGKSNQPAAINAAIRAECPGGNEALEALTLLKQIADRHGWQGENGTASVPAMAYGRVLEIVAAMERAVRARWGLPGI